MTPVAVGGAAGAQGLPDGLRVASLRGVLRWWFRTASWRGDSKELLSAEQRVFGGGEAGTVVPVWVTERKTSLRKALLRMNDPTPVLDRRGRPIIPSRSAYDAGAAWTLEWVWPATVPAVSMEQFRAALDLFLLLGGVGGRSRRGFGSLWDGDERGFRDPIAGGSVADRGAWLEARLAEALRRLGAPQGGSAGPPPRGMRVLRRGEVRVFLVESDSGPWASWNEAMDHLRDDFYRPLKQALGVTAIGSGDPREASPLLVQIKPAEQGLVGLVVAFRWNGFASSHGPWGKLDRAHASGFTGLRVEEVTVP